MVQFFVFLCHDRMPPVTKIEFVAVVLKLGKFLSIPIQSRLRLHTLANFFLFLLFDFEVCVTLYKDTSAIIVY